MTGGIFFFFFFFCFAKFRKEKEKEKLKKWCPREGAMPEVVHSPVHKEIPLLFFLFLLLSFSLFFLAPKFLRWIGFPRKTPASPFMSFFYSRNKLAGNGLIV